MKFKIVIIFILTILLAGCEKFLERKPIGTQTTDSFLGNPETAATSFEQMINAAYSCFSAGESFWNSNRHHFENMFGDWLSDDCEKGGDGAGDFSEVLDWRRWDATPLSTTHDGTAWVIGYVGVARANAVLEALDLYGSNLEESMRNRIKGEALFIRGYFYFYLVKVYGSVPYFDHPVLPDEFKNQPKVSPEEIYALIEADLQAAVPLVPEKSAFDVWPGGRATKGAVRSILARVIAMEIGFDYNGKTWQEVYDITKAIINSGEYSLVANYATIFEQEGEQNAEAVFEIECNDINQSPYGAPGGNMEVRMTTFRPQAGNTGKHLATGGWGFTTPSENLSNEFEAGDPRRPCTIIENGQILWEDGNPATNEQIIVIKDAQCPTGYWLRKYATSAETVPSANPNGRNNMRKVRYSDVLLLCAEAAYHISLEDEARSFVNEVRTRARNSTGPKGSELNNPMYPSASSDPTLLPPVTATGDALLAAIKHERRVELALEGNRTWDLIRWGEYEDAITKYVTEDFFLSTEDPAEIVANYQSHLIDGKVPCLPIPPTEVESFGLLQNPGY